MPFLADCPGGLTVEPTPLGATLIDSIHFRTEWARADGDAVLEAPSPR